MTGLDQSTASTGDPREVIVDAAIDLFLTGGFDRTLMDAIASQARVSKATLYKQFSDKDELFKTAVEHAAARLALQLDESALLARERPEEQLEDVLLRILELTTSADFLALLRLISTESHQLPPLSHLFETIGLERAVQIVASILAADARHAEHGAPDAVASARFLLEVAIAPPQLDCLLIAKLQPGRELLRAYSRAVVSILLAGIRPDPGGNTALLARAPDYPWERFIAEQTPPSPSPESGAVRAKQRAPGIQARRDRVVEAASELFFAEGFDRTSMDAVAARAGVSKTTVYAHYRDKVALFRAVVERGTRALTAQLDDLHVEVTGDPEHELKKLLVAPLAPTTSSDFVSLLRITAAEAVRRPELVEILNEARVKDPIGLIQTVASLLERDARERGYALTDSGIFAAALMDLARASLQLQLLLGDRQRRSSSLEVHAETIVDVFLNGLRHYPS